MRRIAALLALQLCALAPAFAQDTARPPVVGVLRIDTTAGASPFVGMYRDALAALGYVDGKNLRLDIRLAEGDTERLPELAEALVRSRITGSMGKRSFGGHRTPKAGRVLGHLLARPDRAGDRVCVLSPGHRFPWAAYSRGRDKSVSVPNQQHRPSMVALDLRVWLRDRRNGAGDMVSMTCRACRTPGF
jgi:hypothetical protein